VVLVVFAPALVVFVVLALLVRALALLGAPGVQASRRCSTSLRRHEAPIVESFPVGGTCAPGRD
jgi:hypothetical protein